MVWDKVRVRVENSVRNSVCQPSYGICAYIINNFIICVILE